MTIQTNMLKLWTPEESIFCVFVYDGNKEIRVLIKRCFRVENIPSKQWLDKHYGTSAPGK